jgi:D-alanyl-D-alanine carboxypeptidase/D-alanyl-D-alanine-endopeptidase (penicillin-binding protein 4)
MMEEILGRSNNFYTEMLLRTAAAKATREPATAASAVQVLRSWVASQGMDSASVMVQDGSGLSAAALVNAGLISEVLHKVRSKPWFEVFERSLATPGKPGTLQSRYTQTAFASGLRAKTGYISGVRSLSGYLICKSGQKVSFSLITNHFTVKTAVIDKVHEQFLQLAYENL